MATTRWRSQVTDARRLPFDQIARERITQRLDAAATTADTSRAGAERRSSVPTAYKSVSSLLSSLRCGRSRGRATAPAPCPVRIAFATSGKADHAGALVVRIAVVESLHGEPQQIGLRGGPLSRSAQERSARSGNVVRASASAPPATTHAAEPVQRSDGSRRVSFE